MITVAGLDIIGNSATASISLSIESFVHQWKMRNAVLTARTLTGHKAIEVETISGSRVVVHGPTGAYNPVPMNNDQLMFELTDLYSVLTLSVSAPGCDAALVESLIAVERLSADWHVRRRFITDRLSASEISYPKKVELASELLLLDTDDGFAVTVPGLSPMYNCQFAETDGVSASYWTNGPYVDVKLKIVSRRRISL